MSVSLIEDFGTYFMPRGLWLLGLGRDVGGGKPKSSRHEICAKVLYERDTYREPFIHSNLAQCGTASLISLSLVAQCGAVSLISLSLVAQCGAVSLISLSLVAQCGTASLISLSLVAQCGAVSLISLSLVAQCGAGSFTSPLPPPLI